MNPVPDFNHLARVYRWLEYLSFGPLLWHCRTRFLPDLMSCRRALVLGDGDGRFTARLLRENRKIEVHALDASQRMIQSLQRAVGSNQDRLTTEIVDIRTWTPAETGKYDLIVSHFFLDCLSTGETAELACRLAPGLAPGALWIISEFAIPQSRFGRILASPLVALLYSAFRLLTDLGQRSLPDYARGLSKSGWILRREVSQIRGLLISQLWHHVPE